MLIYHAIDNQSTTAIIIMVLVTKSQARLVRKSSSNHSYKISCLFVNVNVKRLYTNFSTHLQIQFRCLFLILTVGQVINLLIHHRWTSISQCVCVKISCIQIICEGLQLLIYKHRKSVKHNHKTNQHTLDVIALYELQD